MNVYSLRGRKRLAIEMSGNFLNTTFCPEKPRSLSGRYSFYFLVALNFLISVFFILSSCKSKSHQPPVETDTPTTGELTISADESFAPVVSDEVNNFENIYAQAKIHVNFKPEPDAVSDLINNRVREIVIARKLTNDELSYLRKDYPPRQIMMGIDAVVFIVNKQNADTSFRYDQVVDILSGKILDWKEISNQSSLGKLSIIFDNKRSSMFRYLKEDVLKGKPISPQAFAVDSNEAVISYVEKDPAAIGVIGASRIITLGDTAAKIILTKVKVAGISNQDTAGKEIFYHPFHEELMRKQYPFLRGLYIISREEYAGLGTGFATYVASDEGQTIVERSGLVPAKQPLRIIELKNEF